MSISAGWLREVAHGQKNRFSIVKNRWHMGNREDGADSLASQVKPASHWPGMRVLIAVVSDGNTKIFEGEPILDATAYHGLFFGVGQRQQKEHSKQRWYER